MTHETQYSLCFSAWLDWLCRVTMVTHQRCSLQGLLMRKPKTWCKYDFLMVLVPFFFWIPTFCATKCSVCFNFSTEKRNSLFCALEGDTLFCCIVAFDILPIDLYLMPQVTKECLDKAISICAPGVEFNKIGKTIQ